MVMVILALFLTGSRSASIQVHTDDIQALMDQIESEITEADLKKEEFILFRELCLNMMSVAEWKFIRKGLRDFCELLLLGDIKPDSKFQRERRFLEFDVGKPNDLKSSETNSQVFKYGK